MMTYVNHDWRYYCSFCGRGPSRDGVPITDPPPRLSGDSPGDVRPVWSFPPGRMMRYKILGWACPMCLCDLKALAVKPDGSVCIAWSD